MKTNAARLLDTLGIHYELRDYDPGDEHLTAEEVAARVGLPAEQVFKTLVARSQGSPATASRTPWHSKRSLRSPGTFAAA
jgi:Cys-tRNA(Pro)/Cys-tRNA(Cys) deacylase